MRLPKTLFARTGLTLAVAFILLLIVNGLIFGRYVMGPTTRVASEDAAALLVLSAQTWAELPPDTRADFEDELRISHGITLSEADAPLTPVETWLPYLDLLKQALEARMETAIELGQRSDTANWFQVDLPIADRILRLEFPRERFIPEIPPVLFWLIIAAGLVTLITTLLLVRHLTRPLARLSDATVRFGRGETPVALNESGPEELKNLTRSFNRMTLQLNELLASRTTLLAGISHDMRTPIARLSLALEMLPQEADTALTDRMRTDLKEMDQLITRTLQLARSLDNDETDEVNIAELIDGVIAQYRDRIGHLEWQPGTVCILNVNTVALRRVLTNLIENAVRYGGSHVEVRYQCQSNAAKIDVLDHGPGIPEEQLRTVFQPFYRLEASRNTETGGSGLGLAIVQQLCHANGWLAHLANRPHGGLKASVEILAR